jgi:hypothetical protein
MDFESAGQVFFTGTGFFFQAHSSFNRVADASSTATQRDSYGVFLQNSLWTGAASTQRFSGIRSKASTTDNLDHYLKFFLNVTGGLGTEGVEAFRMAWDDSASTVTHSTTGIVDFGGAASVEVPNATGGTTVDAAGEVTVDTTQGTRGTGTFNLYDGTAERVLSPMRSRSITVESPTSAEDISMFFTNSAITVREMRAVLVGSSTPSVTWTVRHSTDRSAVGNEVVSGGTTTTSTTTGSDVTAFNDATIPADSFVWLETTAQSGTVGQINITVFYTEDP